MGFKYRARQPMFLMPLVSGIQIKGEAECEEATAMGRTSAQLLVRRRPCVQLSCEDRRGLRRLLLLKRKESGE
jgi:hypothetical protein